MGAQFLKLGKMLWEIWHVCLMVVRAVQWRRLDAFVAEGRTEEAYRVADQVTGAWSRSFLDKYRCDIQIEGMENIPETGPYILISNHQSNYDTPLITGYLGQGRGFLTKRELLFMPGLAFWIRHMGGQLLDRGSATSALRTLSVAAESLKASRRSFVIFPEGTRSRDKEGKMGEFKLGSLRMATEQEFPILPVVLDGTRLLDDPQAFYATRHGGRVLRIRILPPVQTQKLKGKARKEFTENLHALMVKNREEIKVSWPMGAAGDSNPSPVIGDGMQNGSDKNGKERGD